MGRPAGWLKGLTGRNPMISPGAPKSRRSVERQFWKEVATGASSEDAGAAVGVSQAVGAVVPPRWWYDNDHTRRARWPVSVLR